MGWLRLDIFRLLLLALPALALNFLLLDLTPSYSEAPRRTALVLAPLFLLVLALALWARRDSTVNLGRAFLFFFPVFCLFFSIATATELLAGKRVLLAGGEQAVPQSFLGLSRLGDWHYWFAPPARSVNDLLVLTLPPFERAEGRRTFAAVIKRSLDHGARGLAFDYFLEKESASDRLLARVLAEASKKSIPVFFGYRHLEVEGELRRQSLSPSLAGAIPEENQGHLSGYREADGRVRMVPVGLPGEGGLRSLSHKIAEALYGGRLPLPENGLLQFTRPRLGVPVHAFSPDMDWGVVRDRFVIVGTQEETDRFDTPYGEVQGSVIHAFAANSLRTGRFIRRLDHRFVFPLLFTGCYLLTVVYVRGYSGRKLVLAAAALSGLYFVAAALAMRSELLWIDVSYPLVGLWSLTFLLLAIRSVRSVSADGRPAIISPDPALLMDEHGRPGTSPLEVPGLAEAAGDAKEWEFDVFLSHNSQDKPRVREFAAALVTRKLKPWLDEEELAPGSSWQDDLEGILRTVRSSAVLVGAQGLGPWEVPEIRASLSESVRRGLPVIPVLLPGAPKKPVLPLFLTQFTWVDLRAGLSEEGLDRLEWGVTGVKPKRRRRRGRSRG